MLARRADMRAASATGLEKGLSARPPDNVRGTGSLATLALILRLAFPLSIAARIPTGLPLAGGIASEWNA